MLHQWALMFLLFDWPIYWQLGLNMFVSIKDNLGLSFLPLQISKPILEPSHCWQELLPDSLRGLHGRSSGDREPRVIPYLAAWSFPVAFGGFTRCKYQGILFMRWFWQQRFGVLVSKGFDSSLYHIIVNFLFWTSQLRCTDKPFGWPTSIISAWSGRYFGALALLLLLSYTLALSGAKRGMLLNPQLQSTSTAMVKLLIRERSI